MKCLNCNDNIVIKRTIINLFSLKKEYICEECFKKSNFNPNQILLPVNNYLIKIYYLISDVEHFKYESLIREYYSLYKKLKLNNELILTFNRYYMSEKNYIFLEQLSNHHGFDIQLLVYQIFD